MNLRTDLAIERRELLSGSSSDGIEAENEEHEGVKLTRIRVINKNGEQALGKPIGEYVTLEVRPFMNNAELFDGRLTLLSREIRRLLPEKGTVLVACLGNESITPDALGPRVAELLLATRHISQEVAKSIGFDSLRSVAGIVPGVLGKTGVETSEIIAGVARIVKPCAVIAVDALASRRLSRLGTTVQLANTGICPGSGVGNSRTGINRDTLGIPVISVGVPTVVDAATLAGDLCERAGLKAEAAFFAQEAAESADMMVTPKEIDLVVERASKLVAMGINCALQPLIEPEELFAIVGA